jgi:hypothetical protein
MPLEESCVVIAIFNYSIDILERLGVRLLITRAFAVDVSFDRERRELSEVESQPTESGPGRLVFKTTGFSLMSKIVSFC